MKSVKHLFLPFYISIFFSLTNIYTVTGSGLPSSTTNPVHRDSTHVTWLSEKEEKRSAQKTPEEWFTAAEQNNIDVMKSLKDTVDVNAQDDLGRTALMHASYLNPHDDALLLLLQIPGININLQNKVGNTALHSAAFNNRIRRVKFLLQRRDIDVNRKNRDGDTVLIFAATVGYTEIVQLLLDVPNINLNARNNSDKTALMAAREENFEEIVTLIQKKISELTTEAFEALNNYNFEKVESILAQIGLENIKDAEGNSMAHEACKNGSVRMLTFLLNQVNDPRTVIDQNNNVGLTPLELASPASELFRFVLDLAYGRKEPIKIPHSKVCQRCSKQSVLICSKCKKVYYCSAQCQKIDWKNHRATCH